MIEIKKLIESNVHFGHKASRWHPKMAPFIWGFKDGIHLINVAKTAIHLEKAAQFLTSVAAERKTILWVGTKKVAQALVAQVGTELGSPYVIHRWIGGTLTNYSQVRKSVTKLLHFEDIINKAHQFSYTKKELVTFQKMADRLNKNVGSIKGFSMPVGAVVVVDVKKEQTALREAAAMGIPVVGLVDTNSDPSLLDYIIPCNDDAASSIKVVLDYLADAVKQGQQKAVQKKESAAQAAQAQKELEHEIIVPEVIASEEVEEVDTKKIPKKKELIKAKEEEEGKLAKTGPGKEWRQEKGKSSKTTRTK